MTFYYLLMLTIVALVAYTGYDETMKICSYADLQIRYAFVMVRMKLMGWKLKKQLIKDTTDFEKFLKEYKNGQ